MQSKIERIKKLTDLLNQYRDSYYNNSISEISDYEYDKLFDELERMEKETGIIMTNSPTQTVGYDVKTKLEKVKHNHPMLSLSKTKSIDDILKFFNGKKGIAMLKMDGLTCSLGYSNNNLISGETRGNGEVGENVLHNVVTVKNVPTKIPLKDLTVDGEMIIDCNTFEEINDKLQEDYKYANSRNLASGSIRQLDSKVAANRGLRFIAWKCIDGIPGNSFSEKLISLYNVGFEIVPFKTVKEDATKEEIECIIDGLKSEAQSKGFPFDGIVFGFDDIGYGDSLGMTSHHVNSQIAFKFYDEEVETTLKDIEWTMGKTGVLTPTAIFDPVEIEGTIVERASLHNLSVMQNLYPYKWYSGLALAVYKANQIIPQVSKVEYKFSSKSKRLDPPTLCPICKGNTEIKQENDTKVLVCSNPNCKGKLLGKLSHFVSKNAINIDGLSEQTLQKFIDLEWVNSFYDIMHLKDYKSQMKELDGFGERSVDKLLSSIEQARHTTLDRFIYALSIPLIGRTASKTISKYFDGNFKSFIKTGSNILFDWTQLDDFGKAMETSMMRFLLNDMNNMIKLSKEFVFENQSIQSSKNSLIGKTFVITGTLNHYSNRNELVSLIENLGGKVSGSVSKKTSFLINNDKESSSSKNNKAKSLNIPIISENDFRKMIL